MTAHEEYFQTLQPNEKAGVKIKRDRYNAISDFIISTLEEEKEITINKLIEKATYQFWDELKDETGWYIYHVKLDMEARGLVKTERSEKKKKTFIVRNHRSRGKKNSAHLSIENTEEKVKDVLSRNLKARFVELFHDEPFVVSSPGVVNLIGEHTDYNFGFTMQTAVDRAIQFAIAPSSDPDPVIYSMAGEMFRTIERDTHETPVEFNIFSSVLRQLRAKGHVVPSFNCVFLNDLPPNRENSWYPAAASGFVFALNLIFDLKLSVLQMIRIAQLARNDKSEPKAGIVDHFTSILCKDKHALILDCQRLTYNYYALDLKEYCMLVCDASIPNPAKDLIDHRKAECAEGLDVLKKMYPTVNSLRDVSLENLIGSVSSMPFHVLKRCQYVIQENERVHLGGKYLDVGKLKAFGQNMYKTHEGLTRLYEVSCPEIDFLVNHTKNITGILGARLIADISGGHTLNIVHKNSVGAVTDELGSLYKKQFGLDLNTFVLNTSAGAALIDSPKTAQVKVA